MPEFRADGYNRPHVIVTNQRESMDQLLVQLIPFVYVGIILYAANQAALTGGMTLILRLLLSSTAALGAFYGASILLSAFVDNTEVMQISARAGMVAAGVAVAAGVISYACIFSPDVRRRVGRVFGRNSTYNPESPVHVTAIVLSLTLVSFTITNFIAAGGISGLAESLEADQSAIPTLILNQVLWILAALLGVGLFIRRQPAQAAARLGLRFPTPQDFNWGLGLGLLAYLGVIGIIAVWTLVVSPEQFAEQTAASAELAGVFTSLPQVLILSILIGIGEETFFRGAIQPVFGIGFTSVFFTVLHSQYTLTPATLALFGVSLVLGWLRQRHSTSAAIIAHFIYNFVQLALGLLAIGS